MARGDDRLTRKLLLAAGSVLLVLAVGEGLLRLFWDNPYASESPDLVLPLWIPHANANRIIDRSRIDPEIPQVRLRVDARGYIRPSFRYSDPDLTIAFMGGSTTANTAVQEALRFHAVVADELEKDGLRVNALNSARPGGALADSLNVLLNHVVFDAPDLVVLMHATNDVGVLTEFGSYRVREPTPVSLGHLARWVAQMLSSRLHLVGRVRQTQIGVLAPSPDAMMDAKNDPARPKVPTRPFRSRLLAFVHLCRDFGMEPVLMTQPLSSSRNALTPDWADLGNQDVFNAIIREVGRQEAVLVIDLVTYLREEIADWNAPMHLFWDGMHVTDEGSRVVGKEIARALRPTAQRIARESRTR